MKQNSETIQKHLANLKAMVGITTKKLSSPASNKSDDREAFEERAAILEFDAGLSRAEAELAARTLSRKP